MEAECYPSSIMPHSSRLFLDFSESSVPLAPFYPNAPTGRNWMSLGRALSVKHRSQLADLLLTQNNLFGGGERTAANIARLRGGASAVVTGQQVGLFGGPLYSLLKAATAIARAQEASQAGVETVPVFWLASEDHDFDEIAHADLLAGGRLERVSLTPAPELTVPVGGIQPGPRLEALLRQAEPLLAGGPMYDLLRSAYHPQATLGEAFGSLIAQLFAPWGLVVIDAAGSGYHALGAPILTDAICRADALHALLDERNRELAERGYHAQVLVGEQSSLLFLLDAKTQARLALRRVVVDGECLWKAGAQRYTSQRLLEILQATPECLSPNALLRPIFQDAILPTSAYVAGPAEIAYFAQSNVLYSTMLGRPTAVLPRLSVTLVDPRLAAVMDRHELSLPDAFSTGEVLAQRLAARSMPVEGKQRLAAAGIALDHELSSVIDWMSRMDGGLGQAASTAASKMRYQMNRLRRLAAHHQLEKEASLVRHARAIADALYPGGHLQERKVAGISFLAQHGESLLETLIAAAADACPGHKLLPL